MDDKSGGTVAATISAVKPRYFSSRRAKVNLPRSQIGRDLGPASGYIRAGCDGARSRGLDRRDAPPAWENGRLFRLFLSRRDKAELKTVDISCASRPATRKR